MKKESLFLRARNIFERYLPMTLPSLLIFCFIIYFLVVVGRTTWENYKSNQSLVAESDKISALEQNIKEMQNEINYYSTGDFREKEAREKLGYRAPGEKVISLPLDKPEDRVSDEVREEVKPKIRNYLNWWRYFFG